MKAVFRGGELEDKSCIIRDFCPGGFFLSWPDEKTGSQIIAIKDSLLEETYSVEFKVKHKKSGDKTYSIAFKVIRIFQSGMGVSFVEPDQSVLDVLIKISEATQKKKQTESEKESSAIQSDDHTSFFNKSLLGQINLESNLDQILSSFLKEA